MSFLRPAVVYGEPQRFAVLRRLEGMRIRPAAVAWTLLGIVVATAACSSGNRTSASPPSSRAATQPSTGTSASHSTDVCGAWSAVNSPQARSVRAQHGTIDSCQRVGLTWFVTAISETRPGQVGYLACSAADRPCLDGSIAHDLSQFTWVSAPAAIGPGLRLYSAPTPHEWIFSTRRHGMVRFDLTSKTFAICPSGVCR